MVMVMVNSRRWLLYGILLAMSPVVALGQTPQREQRDTRRAPKWSRELQTQVTDSLVQAAIAAGQEADERPGLCVLDVGLLLTPYNRIAHRVFKLKERLIEFTPDSLRPEDTDPRMIVVFAQSKITDLITDLEGAVIKIPGENDAPEEIIRPDSSDMNVNVYTNLYGAEAQGSSGTFWFDPEEFVHAAQNKKSKLVFIRTEGENIEADLEGRVYRESIWAAGGTASDPCR